jgi:competence protein comEA helix-hairpin-helix repeat region
MKKKEIIISVAIAFVLSLIMFFVTQSKGSGNMIVDKSSKNKALKSQNTENIQDKKLEKSVNEDEKDQIDVKESTDNSGEKKIESSEIAVYISGEVKTPQVVRMKTGDRLVDAVEKCGGMTKDADLNAVNLALLLKDEAHYIIPKIGEVNITSAQSNTNTVSVGDREINQSLSNTESSNSKVNINTADKTTLMSLPSIGEKTAQKIIDYRENVGKFNTKEDLKNVSGIGDKKYSQLEEFITVD